jgi:chromosomal replication initiation ATPase DnaA
VSQIPFDLPHRTALGRDDFFAAPGNRTALALVESWPDWPSHAAILVGPDGSGKSHLAQIWRARSGAQSFPAPLSSKVFLAEDCDRGIDERALFHALNHARQEGGHILMTARSYPASWNIALPDLASRLRAAPVTEIGLPDDGLLRSVLVKLFADRQIAVDEGTVAYLIARMPRLLGDARELVAEIDRQALAERAEVTRQFVARVMAGREEPGLFDADP